MIIATRLTVNLLINESKPNEIRISTLMKFQNYKTIYKMSHKIHINQQLAVLSSL